MSRLRNFALRLHGLLRKTKLDRDLDEELRTHLSFEIDQNVRRGMSADDARRAALHRFGGVEQTKENYRARRGLPLLETLVQDIRFGVRVLCRNPGFTMVAVLSLALGVGANSAVFSIVDALFLRPLPVQDPSQLAVIFTEAEKDPGFDFSSYPDFLDVRKQVSAFSDVLAYGNRGAFVSGEERGAQVDISVVSENYFDALGVSAAWGRTFSTQGSPVAAEDRSVVISHAIWLRRFGADPSLPGKSIQIDGKGFTVLGIAPQNFHGLEKGSSTDLWVTPGGWSALMEGARQEFELRQDRWFSVVGRLRPGAQFQQAQMQLNTVAERLAQTYPAADMKIRFRVIPAAVKAREGLSSGLFLLAMVGIVLLISSVNVANLLLAQMERRQREIAVRLALGVSRKRLISQLFTENLMLALLAGACGLPLAAWLLNLVPVLTPLSSIQPGADFRLDSRVLLFTIAVSLVTTVLFGLAPALQSLRFDLVTALKGESALLGKRRSRVTLRNAMVMGEVTLGMALLVSSGLLLRSLLYSQHIGPGFDTTRNVLMLTMAPPSLYGYTEKQESALYDALLTRVETLPGVISATYGRRPPLSGDEIGEMEDVSVSGDAASPDGAHLRVRYNIVARGFFRALGGTLLEGREFNASDTMAAPRVVVINESLARLCWPNRSAIGRTIRVGKKDIQVVGVVQDGKYIDLHQSVEPYLFLPMSQVPSTEAVFFLQTAGDSQRLTQALVREVQSLDKNIPVVEATTLRDYMRDILATERFSALLLGSLALLGMLLAAVGIYAVVAYTVSQRTREIGIRMALGAHPAHIMKLILGQGLRLALWGAVAGFFVAYAVGKVMSSRLYGVNPGDPLTYAASVALVLAIAMLAAYVPARRTTKVDPTTALRNE